MTEPQTALESSEAGDSEPSFTDRLLAAYDQSIAATGDKTYAHCGLALFHSLSDERAMDQLLKFGFKARDAYDHYNLGCVHARDGKFEKAAAEFAKALEGKPDFAEARFNLALALEKTGKVNEARKLWKEAADAAGDEEEAAKIRQHTRELPAA